MNIVYISGRAVRDVDLSYLKGGGTALAKVTMAVPKNLSKEKREEFESQNKPTADFLSITVFGKQAEFLANYLVKGNRFGVKGRLQTGQYEHKDGHTVYTIDVIAEEIDMIDWKNDNSSNNQGNDFGGIDGFHPTDNSDIPF